MYIKLEDMCLDLSMMISSQDDYISELINIQKILIHFSFNPENNEMDH